VRVRVSRTRTYICLPIEVSETSTIGPKRRGIAPKENILHIEHDESLKSNMSLLLCNYEMRTSHSVSVRKPERNHLEDVGVQYDNRLNS